MRESEIHKNGVHHAFEATFQPVFVAGSHDHLLVDLCAAGIISDD